MTTKTNKQKLRELETDFRDFLKKPYGGKGLYWFLGELDYYMEKFEEIAKQQGREEVMDAISRYIELNINSRWVIADLLKTLKKEL